MGQGPHGASGKPDAVRNLLFGESICEKFGRGDIAFDGVQHENFSESLGLDCSGYHRGSVGCGCHSLSGYRLTQGTGACSGKEVRS